MKKQEWNENLNDPDHDLVEDYMEQKSKPPKKLWLRAGVIAVWILLIISGVLTAYLLREKPVKLTGQQEITYGEPWSDGLTYITARPPRFYLDTVVQANVIEVLPDYYYEPDSDYRYLIARLSIVEVILGDGLPDELLLRFPYYTADIFDGYDTFIFSLEQIGIENYMLINDTTREVTYFPHMFDGGDLGYGGVIAFNGGKVDTSFFDKTDQRVKAFHYKDDFLKMLEDPSTHAYPVGYDTTLEEAKANIRALIQEGGIENSARRYITADDIFITDEQKQLMAYLAPSDTSVFLQRVTCYADRVSAGYTRVVNGFLTDEEIGFNGYYAGFYGDDENGKIHKSEASYSKEDLAKLPNLGKILAEMDLSQMQPPHIEITDEMQFYSSTATGVYRKVEDQVCGIIRVMWHYSTDPDRLLVGIKDGCYYVYDQEGSYSIVEAIELQKLLGVDPFIRNYNIAK